jgi:hypothetical protein
VEWKSACATHSKLVGSLKEDGRVDRPDFASGAISVSGKDIETAGSALFLRTVGRSAT